jgi:hypothetical protein
MLPLVIGCSGAPYGAPMGAQLVVESTGAIFDAAFNDPDDGVGLLLREQVMVVDSGGVPMPSILVEITSGWSAAYIIPSGAVKTVDEFETECESNAAEECELWFDLETETYVEFSGDYVDLGGFRPTYMAGGTDNRGILDFYVFIDAIPVDSEGEVIPIPVYADIGVDIENWTYDFE